VDAELTFTRRSKALITQISRMAPEPMRGTGAAKVLVDCLITDAGGAVSAG
jgi:hypothetical protein